MFQFRSMNASRDSKFLIKLGKNLRKIREESNLTQEALSHKAEIPRSQVARIERGEVNPTISTLKRIADVLKVGVAQLVQFE